MQIDLLPSDAIIYTFNFLNAYEVVKVRQVCHLFKECSESTNICRLYTTWTEMEPRAPMSISHLGPSLISTTLAQIETKPLNAKNFRESQFQDSNVWQDASAAINPREVYRCVTTERFCVLYNTKVMTVLTINAQTGVFQKLWQQNAKVESNILHQYSDVLCNKTAFIRKITPAGQYLATEFESLDPQTGQLRMRYKCPEQKNLEDHFWLLEEVTFWQEEAHELSACTIYGKMFPRKTFSHPIQVLQDQKEKDIFQIIEGKPGIFERIKKTTRLTLRRLSNSTTSNFSEILHRGKETMNLMVARIYAFSNHHYFHHRAD